jgi:polyisoprenoid-binding protein YceI
MAIWNLDPTHTRANFSARHMMVTTVRGGFDKVSGTVNFDPQNPAASSVEATIEAASINTGVADRDNHLRSADFLDVENYPTITFKSTNVKVTSDTTADVTGDLTIRGTTRPVTLKVEFLGEAYGFESQRAGFEASARINREDFGLTWNVALETGGVLVGKEITLNIDAEAIKVPEGAPATASA